MDDDIVDLMVVTGVAGVGFIALTYLVTKAYLNQIRMYLLWFNKQNGKQIIVLPKIISEHLNRPETLFSARKFGVVSVRSRENTDRIASRSDVLLHDLTTKRVWINVGNCSEELEFSTGSGHNLSLSFSSRKAIVQRRRTL